MKANRLKKMILVLLALILVYVWSGNLSMFTTSQSSIGIISDVSQAETQGDDAARAPQYMEARINPFKKPGSVSTSPAPARKKPEPPKPPPTKPSGLYLFTGVVERQEFSQAVFEDKGGKAVIRGIGDSIGIWELTYVSMNMVVLTCDKFKDTLFLAE